MRNGSYRILQLELEKQDRKRDHEYHGILGVNVLFSICFKS